MTKTRWIVFIIICAAAVAGLYFMSTKDKVDVGNIDTSKVLAASEQSGDIADHVYGDKNSKVVLVEYGDFQCPGCGGVYPTVKELKEKYKDKIAFVFRNMPLSQIHPNARAAASAAEAAGLQGKFWDMVDLLYTNQSAWEKLSSNDRTNFFVSYAERLGLNKDQFTSDMSSDKVVKKIRFDTALAKKVNVTGTPTFILSGQTIDQPTWSDSAKFSEAIEKALK